MCLCVLYYVFFFSSVRQHTRCALVTGFRRVLFRSPAATPRPVERRTQDDIGPGALRRAQIGGVEGGDVDIAARRLAGTLPPFGSQPRNARGKRLAGETFDLPAARRTEEHTSETQSLIRNSYAVFRLNTKTENSST